MQSSVNHRIASRILPPRLWGDGKPEGVQQRATEEMKNTARAAAKLGVKQVNGFTGSPIWHLIYSFPPNNPATLEAGYKDGWAYRQKKMGGGS